MQPLGSILVHMSWGLSGSPTLNALNTVIYPQGLKQQYSEELERLKAELSEKSF